MIAQSRNLENLSRIFVFIMFLFSRASSDFCTWMMLGIRIKGLHCLTLTSWIFLTMDYSLHFSFPYSCFLWSESWSDPTFRWISSCLWINSDANQLLFETLVMTLWTDHRRWFVSAPISSASVSSLNFFYVDAKFPKTFFLYTSLSLRNLYHYLIP